MWAKPRCNLYLMYPLHSWKIATILATKTIAVFSNHAPRLLLKSSKSQLSSVLANAFSQISFSYPLVTPTFLLISSFKYVL